jgi:hypothetical protein
MLLLVYRVLEQRLLQSFLLYSSVGLTYRTDAKGIECDSKIAKISEEQLKEILEQVRRLRKKRKTEEDNKRQKEEQISVH